MNRLLYILLIPFMSCQLQAAQTDSKKKEIFLEKDWSYILGSGNMYAADSQPPLVTYKQLEKNCNNQLENRPVVALGVWNENKEPFLQQNYIWEKIGKPNHPNEYLRTKTKKHNDGCNRWHQIHVDSAQTDYSYPQPCIPTVEQIQTRKKQLNSKSRQIRQQYERALAHQQALLAQEILNIIKPVAALVKINKADHHHALYLKHCQKRADDLHATKVGLRKEIPLDIQEYLKKNPETWNLLKMWAHLEEQEAALDHERVCEQKAYESLQEEKARTKEQLQNSWLTFDQIAMSNATLAQQAYAEKRRRLINANPNIDTTSINLTNEELADYICTYKRQAVLANVISKEELDILASTYPTAIPPCIQGAHAQQLFLQDPEAALIEAAKKILLQKALDRKRAQLIQQDPAIIATNIRLTPEEREECLRIWNISQTLKKITTEQQLKKITDRFPQYTLKIMADDATKPIIKDDYSNAESCLEDEDAQDLGYISAQPELAEPTQKDESSSISAYSLMGFSSFIPWGQ